MQGVKKCIINKEVIERRSSRRLSTLTDQKTYRRSGACFGEVLRSSAASVARYIAIRCARG